MPSQPNLNSPAPTSTPISPAEPPSSDAPELVPAQPQPVAARPQQLTSDYLKKLLERHRTKADYALSFTAVKQQLFEDEIINGRYNIHKRDWSAEEERLKASRADPSRNTAEILHAKRQLEDELALIEGELEQGEQGAKAMSEDDRKAFLRRLEKERKELLRKKEENAKLLEERRAEEEKREREQEEREEAERRARKQQEIADRMRALEEARRRKEEEHRSQTALLKEKMREKTTANRIEETYNLKQNETLEERKKRLAEIRMLHKPIDRKELDAHAEKLEKLHAERLAAQAEAEKPTDKPVTFYKSIFYKRVKEEPKVFLDKLSEEQVGKLRENRDRLKKFSEQVRENYKPTIDEKKVEEMRFRSVNLRNNRSLSSVNKEHDPQKLGLRYLEYSKQQVEHHRLLASQKDLTEDEEEEEKPKKLDYLAELRKAGKNRTAESAHDLLSKLERGSVSKEEKMKKILEFTDRIEKTAKRKEELSKISSGVDDQLDALYLEAIEAKLGLLDDY